MAMNLRGRSLLSLVEETPTEIRYLLDLARDLKRARYTGFEQRMLEGRSVAMLFEKTSTRTRNAFEVACADQGAHATFLDPSTTQMGHKESVEDTARVLGRMYDAILYRGASQDTLLELHESAGVPVYNGLTDAWHPTQMLADGLTMTEFARKHRHEISYAYLGDARNNMGHSLLLLGAKLGMDVRIAAPAAYQPSARVVDLCRETAERTGATITITEDPDEAVRDVDYVHTDVWVSMGEPPEAWEERIELMRPYRVDAALMAATGNPQVRFMHCLPAYHDRGTTSGAAVIDRYPDLADGLEVTDEVFRSPASLVFDQAENRLHTAKALLIATLA